jgi:serine/tyrosine/threonine adenylyltransferase
LFDAMHHSQADFTATFRALSEAAEDPQHDRKARALFNTPQQYDQWAMRWRARLQREPGERSLRTAAMKMANPVFIPRNHRIQEVINAAVEGNELGPFLTLSAVLSQPYRDQEAFSDYADPPQPSERVLQTFCGT